MNEFIYMIGDCLLLVLLLLSIRCMTKEKKFGRRERKYLLYSFVALLVSLSLSGLQIYLLPAHPMPQLVMVFFIIIYVLFIERRGLKSLGISSRDLGESAIAGLVVGMAVFLYSAITVIMFYRNVDLSDAFVYLAHNLNLTPWSFLHYVYIGFSEEMIFRGFLQRRFLESMKPAYAILSLALLFSFAHIFGYGVSLESVYQCAQKILVSLIFGYLMYRTDNILSVGIVHTVANFVKLIGGLP